MVHNYHPRSSVVSRLEDAILLVKEKRQVGKQENKSTRSASIDALFTKALYKGTWSPLFVSRAPCGKIAWISTTNSTGVSLQTKCKGSRSHLSFVIAALGYDASK
jgi:hypothetical protein